MVAVLIAAIAFANRGGDDSSTSTSPSTKGSGSGSNSGSAGQPDAAPTAASGKQPVTTKKADIPPGSRTTARAFSLAAANYAVSLGSTGMFRKDSRDKIIDTLFTAEAAAKLKAPLDKAYSANLLTRLGLDAGGNAPEGSTFVSRVTPLGTKTVAYGGSTATVEVWYVGLSGIAGGKSTNPVTSSWNTWTYDMRWSGDDWKVVSYTEKEGPDPGPRRRPGRRLRRDQQGHRASTEGSPMPGNTPGKPHLVLKLAGALTAVQTTAVLLASRRTRHRPPPPPLHQRPTARARYSPARPRLCENEQGAAGSGSPPQPHRPPSTPSPPSPKAVPTPPPGPSTSSATP